MRILLTSLFIFLIFQSFSKANDISEFKIDDISIGDSLLDLFNKDVIEKSKADYYKDNTYSTISFDSLSEEYNEIQVSWKTSDVEYKIADVTGGVYQDNMDDCYKKMIEVKNQLASFFNIKPKKKVSTPNPFGLYTYITFLFNSGDQATVSCYDYEDKYEYIDIFRISLETKDFRKWMNSNPYE